MTPPGQEFVVALRGEVYLTDVRDNSSIEVRWAGDGCSAALANVVATASSQTTIPIMCGGNR
jgi:hypothetical protein